MDAARWRDDEDRADWMLANVGALDRNELDDEENAAADLIICEATWVLAMNGPLDRFLAMNR